MKHELTQKRKDSDNRVHRVVLQLLEKIDTPMALSFFIQLKNRQMPQTAVSPINYVDAHSYLLDSQAEALFKKNPHLDVEMGDLTQVAIQKFLDCEDQCRKTNAIFARKDFSFHDRSLLETARHYVEKILGRFEDYGPLDWGPGATYHCKGRFSDIITKFSTKPECTSLSHREVLYQVLDKLPHYSISCGLVQRDRTTVTLTTTQLPLVNGNRFTTVPKDCRAERPICVEPMGNMLLQKGLGSAIKSRLRKWGLAIEYSPDRTSERQVYHRELARLASIDGLNATIDLSSASDTICLELVRFLLPSDWFDKLYLARSPNTLMPNGEWIRNEKFSSMGNGFTFELETLIFYSLALACRYVFGKKSDIVSVYGDDTIVPSAWANKLIDLLEVCGFSTNKSKTFISSHFNESCGGDYFLGHSVRPVFIKDLGDLNDLKFITLANRIREISSRLLLPGFICSSFSRIWLYAACGVRENTVIPVGSERCDFTGDEIVGALHCTRLEANIIGRKRRIIRPKVCNGITRSPELVMLTKPKKSSQCDLLMACALYGIPSSGVSIPVKGTRMRFSYGRKGYSSASIC
jgi:hypothetical protein